jgi:hypothetical protein
VQERAHSCRRVAATKVQMTYSVPPHLYKPGDRLRRVLTKPARPIDDSYPFCSY